MRFLAALANRLGNRASNQDRCRLVNRGAAVLLMVADGMGGHARGELAAQALVDSVEASFRDQALPVDAPEEFLRQALARAHADILAEGLRQASPVYPRTTAVICLVQNNHAWWAHVGDSRLYLIREGQVLVRTRDHTYVEELVRRRALPESEAPFHPMRNCVTECVGGPQAPSRPTLGAAELQIGDSILLCSDGFWGALDEERWLHGLHRPELDDALQELADAAERNGYPNSDNVSALVLRLLATQEIPLENTDNHEAAAPRGREDPLDHAIANIKAALQDYRHELDDD